MRYIHNTTEFQLDRPSAVTLGKFDGLHRGHQKLLAEILRLQRENYYGIVFTIAPENRPVLLTPEEKRELLELRGIDCMLRCPFIPEVLGMEPEAFVAEVLSRRLNAKYVVVGDDFRFGHNRNGDVNLLKALQEKYGYKLRVIPKECHMGREISSTWIREALQEADMELAGELLGRGYPIRGTVLRGHRLGRRIGMPTINLVPDSYKLLPPPGVYYSNVAAKDLNCHGITNIGYKPTVDGTFLGVETYLYGIHEDLYGREVEVSICKFRRPEQKFASVEELKAQMERDILSGKEFFGVN